MKPCRLLTFSNCSVFIVSGLPGVGLRSGPAILSDRARIRPRPGPAFAAPSRRTSRAGSISRASSARLVARWRRVVVARRPACAVPGSGPAAGSSRVGPHRRRPGGPAPRRPSPPAPRRVSSAGPSCAGRSFPLVGRRVDVERASPALDRRSRPARRVVPAGRSSQRARPERSRGPRRGRSPPVVSSSSRGPGIRTMLLPHRDGGEVPKRRRAPPMGGPFVRNRRRPTLPGGLPPSTIGANGLNFRVRNGNGCISVAITTEIGNRLRRSRAACSLALPTAAAATIGSTDRIDFKERGMIPRAFHSEHEHE